MTPTIGIEVHALLKTEKKAFSNSLNSWSKDPNLNIVLEDIAYPGTLPTINKEVIKKALKTSNALNCKINRKMYFDRKNYFYPDLPKGYQITQDKTPIGYNGYIEIELNKKLKKIPINRIHIEEDTCKSIHESNKTLLDYNRAGAPLIEIVTEPVLKSAEEAYKYVEAIRETLLYLGVSDVKIEEGSMRCDVNVSLGEKNKLGTKVEIKNIGSLSNVKESILYEIKRQEKLIKEGKKIKASTRRFDEATNKTVLMREKEETDYRFFPDPNIPYIYLTDNIIETVLKEKPVLPNELRKKYKDLNINLNTINTIINNYNMCMFFETVYQKINPIIGANVLTGEISNILNKTKRDFKDLLITETNFIKLINLFETEEISSKQLKQLVPILLETKKDITKIINELDLKQINNEEEIIEIIREIIKTNAQSVIDYKSGNERALKYLMGQIMKKTKGQVNPKLANKLLKKQLDLNLN